MIRSIVQISRQRSIVNHSENLVLNLKTFTENKVNFACFFTRTPVPDASTFGRVKGASIVSRLKAHALLDGVRS